MLAMKKSVVDRILASKEKKAVSWVLIAQVFPSHFQHLMRLASEHENLIIGFGVKTLKILLTMKKSIVFGVK